MIIFARPPPPPPQMEIDQTLKCDIRKNQVDIFSLKYDYDNKILVYQI